MYKLVPVEPTEEMLQAIRDVCLNTSIGGGNGWLDYARKIYDTALETAPCPRRPIAEAEEYKDGRDVFVWYDHEADPYQHPTRKDCLTDYATWAEGGNFLDGKGRCLARWFDRQWEATDEYGGRYWLPPAWFFKDPYGDYSVVCNPTHFTPLEWLGSPEDGQ